MDLHWWRRWWWRLRWRETQRQRPISLKKFASLCNKFHLISSDFICSRCEIEWSVMEKQRQQQRHGCMHRMVDIALCAIMQDATPHISNYLICNNNLCALMPSIPCASCIAAIMSCCVKCFSQRQWEQITGTVSSYRLRAQHFIPFCYYYFFRSVHLRLFYAFQFLRRVGARWRNRLGSKSKAETFPSGIECCGYMKSVWGSQ